MAKVILQVEDRPKLTRKSRCESTNKMESLKNVLFEVREHVAYITLFLHQAIHRFARMRAPVKEAFVSGLPMFGDEFPA